MNYFNHDQNLLKKKVGQKENNHRKLFTSERSLTQDKSSKSFWGYDKYSYSSYSSYYYNTDFSFGTSCKSHGDCGAYEYCNKDYKCDYYCICEYKEDPIDGKCVPNSRDVYCGTTIETVSPIESMCYSHRYCGSHEYCNRDYKCDNFCNCLYNEDSIDGKCIPNTSEYIKCDDKPTTEAPTR